MNQGVRSKHNLKVLHPHTHSLSRKHEKILLKQLFRATYSLLRSYCAAVYDEEVATCSSYTVHGSLRRSGSEFACGRVRRPRSLRTDRCRRRIIMKHRQNPKCAAQQRCFGSYGPACSTAHQTADVSDSSMPFGWYNGCQTR